MRAFDPTSALDWVGRYGLTFLMGAPLARAAVLRYQELLTPRIFNGTTEAFWNTFLRPEDPPEHAGMAGRACTDDEVALVRFFPDRRAEPDELADRDNIEQGEIIMRTPKSGFSSANLPEVTEQKNPWTTGCIPGTCARGTTTDLSPLWGTGTPCPLRRCKHSPVQVEEVLGSRTGLQENVVVGLPDEHWGRKVVAYVVRRDVTVIADALDRHCLASPDLSDFMRPRTCAFVDNLPLTATRKKIHYQLAEQTVEGPRGRPV